MAFRNCTELNRVHEYGVKKGHPAYEKRLDRDDDGVACEQQGNEGLATSAPKPSPSPAPSPAVSSSAKTEAAVGKQLPQTGPGEVTAVGIGVVLFGVVAVLAFRKRKVYFRA